MRGFLWTVALLLLVAPAWALDKADELQFQRYDQMISRLQDQNEELMKQMRDLQRKNADMAKAVDLAVSKGEAASDQMQKIQNTQLNNLQAGQQQIMDKMKAKAPVYDWGSAARDCPDVGVKHQQIKVMTKPDGSRTVRFLCFDGKLLHLGTEVHDPATAR